MNLLKHIAFLFCVIIAQPMMAQVSIPLPNILAQPGQGTKTLVIGVDQFSPPFVMSVGNGELYGYDISMMSSLCKIMKRTCTFKIIKWVHLLESVMENQVDFAVSSITITPERAKLINFSLPYSLSNSRFLTNGDTPITEPFKLSALNGKRIGVYKGTVYADLVNRIGVKNPIVITYNGYDDALRGLTDKNVDYILLDNPTALYWASNSSGAFKVIGEPYEYGFGYGIAVSKSNVDLIPALNKAILEYQNTDEYHQNYHRYLEGF